MRHLNDKDSHNSTYINSRIIYIVTNTETWCSAIYYCNHTIPSGSEILKKGPRVTENKIEIKVKWLHWSFFSMYNLQLLGVIK